MKDQKNIPNDVGSIPAQVPNEMPTVTKGPLLSQEEMAGAEHAQYVETPITNQAGCYPTNVKKTIKP